MFPDDQNENKFKIRLEGTISGKMVILNAMPQLAVHHSAVYESINLTHINGNYNAFVNSPNPTYAISDIKLISRNGKEARMNLIKILTLRSWTRSYFGDTNSLANETDDLKSFLGSPPEILKFSAYSTDDRGYMNKIPVVLDKLDINYPNDIDYIPTDNKDNDNLSGVPFPIIMTIGINLIEQHSAIEYEKFNLHQYRNGILKGF
jgi:hypothetical protein